VSAKKQPSKRPPRASTPCARTRWLEEIVEIGLGMAPRAHELRCRAGLDIGQEVHLAVAHRPLLLKDGLLKDGLLKDGRNPHDTSNCG
jgi:hypothetical protein